MKKKFTPKEKAIIAFATMRGDKTLAEISSNYGACSKQIGRWKKIVEEGSPELFADKRKKKDLEQQALIDRLYRIIGQRDTELDWLKKKLHIFDKS